MAERPECRNAVLKLKLGAWLNAPSKRGTADLHRAAALFNVVQNRMVRFWERYVEDHPEVVQPGKRPGDTVLKLPQGFSTVLYHEGTSVAPALSTIIIASASNSLLGSHILKRTPWNHHGQYRRMWQAIMGNEAARPCFRETVLAAPNKTTRLIYTDDSAELVFALWSRQSGRKNLQGRCRIALSGTKKTADGYKKTRVPDGIRRILRKVAADSGKRCCTPDCKKLAAWVTRSLADSGDRYWCDEHAPADAEGCWLLRDSELVWHQGKRRGQGQWFFHMAYQRPPQIESLNRGNVATIALGGSEDSHPFSISMPTAFPWQIGDVRVLLEQYKRLESRRLAMRAKYRDAGSGRKGHGRARVEYGIYPVTRQARHLAERFAKRLVSEIIRYCQRYDCGTLIYDPPRSGKKAQGWFAKNGIPFDWTRLREQLKHKCWLHGIQLLASDEVPDGGDGQNPPQPPAGPADENGAMISAARVTKPVEGNGERMPRLSGSNKRQSGKGQRSRKDVQR